MRTSFSLLCRAINHQLGEMNRCPSELDAPAGTAITWPAGARADTGAAEIKKNEAWRQTEPYPCTLSLVSSGLPPHWARLKWKGTQNIFQSVTWGEGEKKKERKKWSPLVSSQIYVELNWQTALVFLNTELWETAGGTAARGKEEAACGGQLCVHSYLMELFYWK